MAGGLFSGSIENLLKYKELFEIKLQTILHEGWYQNDEAIMTLVEYENPKLFDLYYGDYQSIISNYEKPIYNINLIIDSIYKSIRYNKIEKIYHMIDYLIPYFQKKENQNNSFFYLFLDLHIQLDYHHNECQLNDNIIYWINQEIIQCKTLFYQILKKNKNILSKYVNINLLLSIPQITDLQIDISDPWIWIDKIICLPVSNGKISEDECMAKLREFEIPLHKIIFLKNHHIDPIYLHMQALQMSIHDDFKNIWILEDVMNINVSKKELYSYLSHFNQSIKLWDICMLSFNIGSKDHKIEYISNEPFIQKIKFAQNATSYIVHSSYFSILLQNMQEAKQKLTVKNEHWLYNHDVYWKLLQEKDHWYSFDQQLILRIEL
jgi:hypothetical protein